MSGEKPYPIPSNDQARARLIDELQIERRKEDPFFAHLTASARRIFDAPIAFLTLISRETQAFVRIDGADLEEVPRSHGMCAFTVAARAPVILPDTHDDPRFRDHPIVANPPHIRFSASVPVILSNGFCVGTVCVLDLVPHAPPSEDQIAHLVDLAAMAARFYEVPSEPDPAHVKRLHDIVERSQQEFLSLIGHELRTPLNGIIGLSEFIEPSDEDQAQIVGAIRDSSEHLGRIIASILSFTELASGDISLGEGHVRLSEMLSGAASRFDTIFRLTGKKMQLAGDIPALEMACDPNLLQLALICLIDNVGAHGGTWSQVSAVEEEDGGLAITVRDDGTGIPEDRLDTIWHAFSVGEDVYTRQAGGLGLGLPITRRIAELHAGRFDLQQGEGGITAILRLPPWRISRATEVAA